MQLLDYKILVMILLFIHHCDLTHCFEEVSSGQLKVSVHGDSLPTNLFGKLHIFCNIKTVYLVCWLIFTGTINYDYFIVDQLSFCIPLLKMFCNSNCQVLFYCHFLINY